jgi:hypothetical protein
MLKRIILMCHGTPASRTLFEMRLSGGHTLNRLANNNLNAEENRTHVSWNTGQ